MRSSTSTALEVGSKSVLSYVMWGFFKIPDSMILFVLTTNVNQKWSTGVMQVDTESCLLQFHYNSSLRV